jgi:ketosteroid isomerase-like protein
MSRENVEVVRRFYENLNRGDVEGLVEVVDDEFVMDMSGRIFNPDTYKGHDGIRRFLEGVRDVWESYQWNVQDARVTGDSVVALLHCEAQGRQGGPPVDWRVAWVWRFEGTRPVSLRFYRDPADALEAVGLRE